MAKNKNEQKITIDGVDYALDSLSDNAKAQVVNIQFVDNQMQQLRNELAVADNAMIGYSAALKKEISVISEYSDKK